ncbi:chorismate mutase [Aurantibacillus circumpalustris]|uniref:chorismate mutase n=1 Tax=Aurantibacillus circumpalustris TaxID=3036359 RepID=UPI00295C2F7C|nr:chorismate mutase [Aurantibacillus circumpalustris]
MQFEPLNTWLPEVASPLIIAGPCGAESFDQLMRTAKELKETNKISLFRAGVWKPRTRPNAFEGRGEEALKWLVEVKKEFGFKITVEVANAHHTELALKYGIDVLWIGARTTVNPFSVQEIADVLMGTNTPVMVKNPIHADLQLWLGAIERVYNSGITKIAAIHRGFHFYGKTKYRNKPLWQVPIELRTLFPGLPIICDPSHISGNHELISSVAQKALDLGMNGLMIESHYDPSIALSDAEQQLTPKKLDELISNLVLRKQSSDDPETTDKLLELRKIIDEIDDELMNVLKKRIQIIEEIGAYKKEHDITIFQLERWQEILRTRGQWADKMGISRQHIEKICQLLHEESIRIQNGLMNS